MGLCSASLCQGEGVDFLAFATSTCVLSVYGVVGKEKRENKLLETAELRSPPMRAIGGIGTES